MIQWSDKPIVYPDGKTPDQEARDSARMLGLVMVYAAMWAALTFLLIVLV